MAVRSGLVLLSLSYGLVAQSADVFVSGSTPDAGDGTSGAQAAPVAPGSVDTTPSRFAGADIKAYIAARAAAFSMRSRETDPFGVNQDPDVKPEVSKILSNSPLRRESALPPTPLADVVKLIRVTTIMPRERRFLVGTRSFKENDEFPIVFQGRTMKMKVVEVTPKRILFRDLERGEEAALETGILPPGMILDGGTEMRPPGMVAPVKDIPLQLDFSDPQDN